MRIKNSIINGLMGVGYQFLLLILNFISRKIFLDCLGIEYLGLNGLFTNILVMLSLAELGVGTAINYNLYKPLADDNKKEVAALMNLYKVMYRWIAGCIALVGFILMFFIQYIIKEVSFNLSYIRVIYLLFLTNTVASYLVAYKRSLLYADQKNYIIVKWDMLSSIVGTIAKIISLLATKNYIIFLILQIVFSILPNVLAAKIVNKRYPYIVNAKIKLKGDKLNKVVSDIKNLFIHKLANFIVHSTDNLIISSFIGINTVGLFSNYKLIIGTLNGFIGQAFSGVQASLGNLITVEDKKRIVDIFKRLNFLTFWISSFCAVSLYILIHDFISLWLGEVYLLRGGSIEIVIFNMILMLLATPLWQLMTVSGLFKQDKLNATIEMILNLILSLILVNTIGLPGVFLGTTLSYIVAWVLKTQTIFKYYLNESAREYCTRELLYIGIIGLEVWLVFFIIQQLDIINIHVLFVVKMCICVLIPNIINVILFRNTDDFKYFKNILIRIIKNVIKINN